ncbi:MAG: hypothetical protein KatS3mg110_4124 [Pirellulaceae bacterium]|nr:MAG: hypothetical protein KatS3mg110_4124 [Pirellulaceae bacterium]
MAQSVFVYEYATAGGAWEAWHSEPLVDALEREGRAMAAALAQDLAAAGYSVWMPVCRNGALAWWRNLKPPGCGVGRVALSQDESDQDVRRQWFDMACQQAELTWIVAPECDGILLELVRRAESLGARLLGPSSRFVAIAQDKHVTAETLLRHGVPAPHGFLVDQWQNLPAPPDGGRWIRKPRFGAGSQDVGWLEPPVACESNTASGHCENGGSRPAGWRIERFCEGKPVSIVAVVGEGRAEFLPACAQEPRCDMPFEHQAWTTPAMGSDPVARWLAQLSLAALPECRGYIGFDLILSPDGSGWVVDVNPRLTTSFLCLRQCYTGWLAADIVNFCRGNGVIDKWNGKPVRLERAALAKIACEDAALCDG